MKETKKEILNISGLYANGYVVSLVNRFKHRVIGTITRVLLNSNHSILWYTDLEGKRTHNSDRDTWRLATQEEIDWHLLDPTKNNNVNDMPKEFVITNYEIY